MDQLETILSAVVVSTALSGALIFLFRNWISERLKNAIKHEYDQKLETHKAQLKAQNDVEIEHLKSALQIASMERNIKLSGVFEKVVESMFGINERLVILQDSARDLINPLGETKEIPFIERQQKVLTSIDNFSSYYRPRKPYISLSLTERISQVAKAIAKYAISSATLESKTDEDRETISEQLTKEVEELRKLLDEEIRMELGTWRES